MFGLSLAIVAVGMTVFWFASASHAWPIFDDLRIYQEATRRLLDGGSWYLPRQLDGPYALSHGDVLYPPVAALFIAPWLILPSFTFVAIPIGILAWRVVHYRPAPWTWPLIAACAVFPTTLVYVVFANPSLWIAAFVALALHRGWIGALVLLKPSLAPFALLGVRSRGWSVTVGVLGLLSLPVLGATVLYPQVVMDAQGGGLLYSMQSVPVVLIGLLAYAGSRAPGVSTMGFPRATTMEPTGAA